MSNIYIIDIDKYFNGNHDYEKEEYNRIINKHWYKIPHVINKLGDYCKKNNYKNIIDIGGGSQTYFPPSTHIVDICIKNKNIDTNINIIKADIDFDKIPFQDKYFDFCYSRHTLEDTHNCTFIFNEMTRISGSGFIETPSPLIEAQKGVDFESNFKYSGYLHHRYIIWSEIENNTIHILPKFPLIDLLKFDNNFLKQITCIANIFPIYWNNYYIWDTNNKPNIILYRHGINFDINDDYGPLLYRAIIESIKYTNHFVNNLLK